ncbi:hypothetical protein ABPG75_012287 [Micractinium tetrahymenae]
MAAPRALCCLAPQPAPAYSVFRPSQRASAVLCSATASKATCWLVGAGPGPADLLTVRAAEVLRRAEVVIYDDLGAAAAVEAYAPPSAERVYVGKRGGRPSIKQAEIDELLVQAAASGRTLVRLKGGCPSVFSRVHSELAALRAAGIAYEVVPGVSSALAAPLAAGFPLTHPELSKAFVVTSAHDTDAMDWPALAAQPTAVFLMGGRSLPQIVEQLQRHGRRGDTPVAVVRQAAGEEQAVWRGTLASIVEQTAGERLSPCIVVVGQVASLFVPQ